MNCQVECSRHEVFAATTNSPIAYQLVIAAAASLGVPYADLSAPFSWSEDFGVLIDRYPGAMFTIGAGETYPSLHTVGYDFPDFILELGVRMMVEAVILFCTSKREK
jgi:metal-dependent amidase/aminoacylase/carboxypeptidase family protein